MSVSPSQQADPNAPAAKMPGEVVRGLVSLWIIIHFLGILLAIVTQNEFAQVPSGTGGDLAQSQLANRLKKVPPIDQYIYALGFDVSYNYNLATGSLFDGDFALRLDPGDAAEKNEPLIWPATDIWFGERRERLARLAQSAARVGENGDSTIAALVGKSVLARSGGKELTFNVIRHQPLSLEDARSTDIAQRDPQHNRTYVRAYTANVRLNASGEVSVSVPQQAVDVAAPNRPSPNSTTPPQDSNPSNSNSGSEKNRRNTGRQIADPLPQPERPKSSTTLPPSLFRPSEPPADTSAAPR